MAKRRRFYKANLPTVIWNKKTDKALAEFVNGEFITTDESIAQILVKEGYPEVELDAAEPPDFQANRGEAVEGDVKVMPPKYDEKAAFNKQRAQAALKKAKEPVKKSVPKAKRPVKRRKK